MNSTIDVKEIRWVGSAYGDLLAFPQDPRKKAGFQLGKVQAGLEPNEWKCSAASASWSSWRSVEEHSWDIHRTDIRSPTRMFGSSPWELPLGMAISNKMHNPPHPDETIKELCLKPLGLTVTEAAAGLGIRRKQLSAVVNGRASISPKMAVRLSMAFGISAEMWLNHQLQYNLWVTKKQSKGLRVARFAA